MRLLLGAGTPRWLAARGGIIFWLIDPDAGGRPHPASGPSIRRHHAQVESEDRAPAAPATSLCGAEREQHFLGRYKNRESFSGEPDAVACVGNTWAALIIYPTLIFAWVYLVVLGLASDQTETGGALTLAGMIGTSCKFIGY
jgi:hypothetical protein